MKRSALWFVSLSAVIAVSALYHAESARGTPASGFTATTLAKGRLDEIDVFNQLVGPPDAQQPGNNGDVWLSLQKTRGCLTCTCRATSGYRAEAPAGTHILGIA